MGKIHETHCICMMHVHTRLQPISSIHHCADLFRQGQAAPAGLAVCQVGKGGRIRHKRDR